VYTLGAAAVVHLPDDQTKLAIAALSGFDAHYTKSRLDPWVADAVNASRARLDPAAVAAATAMANASQVDDLIDELIIQPAEVEA
jgi:hypothetical protein